MYSIIGGDGKTYGPVPPAEIERWIREGRADGKTKVKKEGEAEWRELGTIEDFYPKAASTPPTLGRSAGPRQVSIQSGSLPAGGPIDRIPGESPGSWSLRFWRSF
jgi:hypothetical protein